MTLTPERIDELRRLEAAATKGPWMVTPGFSDWGMPKSHAIGTKIDPEYETDEHICDVYSVTPYCIGASRKERDKSAHGNANAALIAAARNAIPELLAALEDAQADLRQARYEAATAAFNETSALRQVTVLDAENARLIAALKALLSEVDETAFRNGWAGRGGRDTARAALQGGEQ